MEKENIFHLHKPIQNLFFQYQYKFSEKTYAEQQLSRINKDLFVLQRDIQQELNHFVYHEKNNDIIVNHPHFKNKHNITADIENYYDTDFMKFKYGVEIPITEDGTSMSYEGPNFLIWITCDECKITLKKEYYKYNENINEEEIKQIGQEEMKRHVLQQKLTEYKKQLLIANSK